MKGRRLKTTGRKYDVHFSHEIEFVSQGKPRILRIPDSKTPQTWEEAKKKVQEAMGWC